MTGQEALNILARNVESLEIDTFYECKGAYQFLEKSLKALEIIKEKNVDIYLMKQARNIEEYNYWISKRAGNYYQLTQEEFDILKEVLE